MKDNFNTINSTKLLWGLAKFVNRNINPYFNKDSASCIINRSQIAKITSVQHRIPSIIVK